MHGLVIPIKQQQKFSIQCIVAKGCCASCFNSDSYRKKKLNYLSLESMEQVETDQNFDRQESPLCYSAFIAGFHIQYYYIDETGKLLLFLAIYLGSGKKSQHKDLVEICIFTSQRTVLKFGCNFANNPCSSVSYLKKLILFRMVFFLCFWDNRENKTDE